MPGFFLKNSLSRDEQAALLLICAGLFFYDMEECIPKCVVQNDNLYDSALQRPGAQINLLDPWLWVTTGEDPQIHSGTCRWGL